MIIYLLSFNDEGAYCAFQSFEKAKSVLWEHYCEEVPVEVRNQYLKDDLETLEKGYIIDYGYIEEITLVEE